MSTRHDPQTARTQHVVVLGTGYAGMAAAIELAARLKQRTDVRVTVVNANELFTERLRLHMTATRQQVAQFNIPKLLEGTGARFIAGWVTAVDANTKTIRIDDEQVLRYDTLVYGLGSVANTTAVAGADEYAYTLNSRQDAEVLADRLAAPRSGTVVVVGSGLTGTESAAEIAEQYPDLNVVLLGRDQPGAAMHPKPRAHLQATLKRLGVQVRSGIEVTKVLPDAVELAGGETIAADIVLWTIGMRASPLAGEAGLSVDERGRILTDATLLSRSPAQADGFVPGGFRRPDAADYDCAKGRCAT